MDRVYRVLNPHHKMYSIKQKDLTKPKHCRLLLMSLMEIYWTNLSNYMINMINGSIITANNTTNKTY